MQKTKQKNTNKRCIPVSENEGKQHCERIVRLETKTNKTQKKNSSAFFDQKQIKRCFTNQKIIKQKSRIKSTEILIGVL